MAFRSNDGQSSCGFRVVCKFDVCPTSRHVGGNCDRSRHSGRSYNFRLTLVKLGIEHLVTDLPNVQHSREQFTDFNRGCSDQNRASGLPHLHDIINDGVVFLSFRLVNQILSIVSGNGAIRWNGHDVQFVDVP